MYDIVSYLWIYVDFIPEKLCEELPLENDIFFTMVEQAGMFPQNIGESITAKPTRAKKVSCLLEHFKSGAKEYLPELLNVMRECKFVNVGKLADEIAEVAKIGMYIYVSVINVEL